MFHVEHAPFFIARIYAYVHAHVRMRMCVHVHVHVRVRVRVHIPACIYRRALLRRVCPAAFS